MYTCIYIYSPILLKTVVEICQDNFFRHMLPSDIFHNLMTALHPQTSPQFFIMLLFYQAGLY